MKKVTAAESILLTQQAIEKLVQNALNGLRVKMQQEMTALGDRFTREVAGIVRDLDEKVKVELRELGTSKRIVNLQELQQPAEDGKVYAHQLHGIPGVVKNSKQKHPEPRDSEENEELPDFWRQNYDYLESPYMNLDKIDKITDRPSYKDKK